MKRFLLGISFIFFGIGAFHVFGIGPGETASDVGNKADEEMHLKAEGHMLDFLMTLQSQRDVSKYVTTTIVDQITIEPFVLHKLQQRGQKLTGLDQLVKDRLNSLVYLEEHSHESPILQAIGVSTYLSNIIALNGIDHSVIADECITLMKSNQNSLIAVPLYYYVTYIAGKQVLPPQSLDSNKDLKVICDVTLKPHP